MSTTSGINNRMWCHEQITGSNFNIKNRNLKIWANRRFNLSMDKTLHHLTRGWEHGLVKPTEDVHPGDWRWKVKSCVLSFYISFCFVESRFLPDNLDFILPSSPTRAELRVHVSTTSLAFATQWTAKKKRHDVSKEGAPTRPRGRLFSGMMTSLTSICSAWEEMKKANRWSLSDVRSRLSDFSVELTGILRLLFCFCGAHVS